MSGSSVERRENGTGTAVATTATPRTEKAYTGHDLTLRELMTIAESLAASGYWEKAKEKHQAFARILAGAEWGVTPFAAMSDIHIIEGKPSPGAGIIAEKLDASEIYDYRVVYLDDKGCTIEILKNSQPRGQASFMEKDARTAGLLNKPNWKNYAEDMYFARALMRAQRRYAPSVFSCKVYDPDEVDYIEGEVIDAKPFLSNATTDTRTGPLPPSPSPALLQSAAVEPPVEGPAGATGTSGPVRIASKSEVDSFVVFLKGIFKQTEVVKSFLGRELPYAWNAIPHDEMENVAEDLKNGAFDLETGERIPPHVLNPESETVDPATGEIQEAVSPDYDPFNDPSMPAAGGEINLAIVKKEIGSIEERLWPITSNRVTETQNIRESLSLPWKYADLDDEQLLTYRDHLRGMAAHKWMK